MRTIILLGAPGAGKGTIAGIVQKGTDFVQISTGNILREALRRETPVGLEAKSYMEAGTLVPDEVIIQLVKDRLSADATPGNYLFDGFPRTLNQARLLDQVLEQQYGNRLEKVFFLDAEKEVVVERLSGREVCSSCEAVYHKKNMPSQVPGVCDRCGGSLYTRKDDLRETILNRLEVYQKEIQELMDYYGSRDLLLRVNASEPAEVVSGRVLEVLGT